MQEKLFKQDHVLDRGRIQVDYGLNKVGGKGNTVTNCGGVRVESIVSRDGEGNRDSVAYVYPEAGIFVYDRARVWEEINYGSFVDVVKSRDVVYYGGAHVNTGNHGVYYPCVEERIAGKGINTYLFCVPEPLGLEFPYWLCGLPLAQASYDVTGKLVNLTKNRYLADITGWGTNVNNATWFESLLCRL